MKENNPVKVLIVLFIILTIIIAAGVAGKGISAYDILDFLLLKPARETMQVFYNLGEKIENKRAYFLSKEALLKQNIALTEENKILTERIKLLQSIYDENIRLQKMLNIKSNKKINFTVAQVIGQVSAPFNFLVIDKGSESGIESKMPVVVTDGKSMFLIGITYSVGMNSTKVLLLTDPNFFVSVKDRNSGQLGIAQGNIKNLKITFKIIEPKIAKGDVLSTTSISSIYPEGIIVGNITKINKKNSLTTTAFVSPSIDLMHLFEVMVINK